MGCSGPYVSVDGSCLRKLNLSGSWKTPKKHAVSACRAVRQEHRMLRANAMANENENTRFVVGGFQLRAPAGHNDENVTFDAVKNLVTEEYGPAVWNALNVALAVIATL